jgi:signal transduction histidine kinase
MCQTQSLYYNIQMIIQHLYQMLFEFIVPNREKLKKAEIRAIHTHLLTVISTGALMWAYAVLAFFTISNPWPCRVGILASTVHLLSPLLYRINRDILFNASVLLFAGLAHQATFAYFTGGFMDRIIIWFGILPFLGAIIAGKRGAIMWCLITLSASGAFLLLHLNGHQFPNAISENGRLIAQAYIVFGWIFLSSILSFTYLYHQERHEEAMGKQKTHVENLFRVLFHDLGNPLALLQMGMESARTAKDPLIQARSLDISQKAVNTMVEITENVRQMYHVRESNGPMDCVPTSLPKVIARLDMLFQTQMREKRIKLMFDPILHQGTIVIVEPVSFLHQVLANILSNAIKFSNEASLITIEAAPYNRDYILLKIKDQGIGMTPEQIAQFSSNDIKCSGLGTRGEKGSGFGLNLMRNFVEKYNGEVHVSSITEGLERGTTFTLKLKGNFT